MLCEFSSEQGGLSSEDCGPIAQKCFFQKILWHCPFMAWRNEGIQFGAFPPPCHEAQTVPDCRVLYFIPKISQQSLPIIGPSALILPAFLLFENVV